MSDDTRKPDQDGADEGQVSEVTSMDPAEADTPISDDQAVAGYPEGESGRPDEPDEAGPNAKPGGNRRENTY